jgi:hypothetical protein
VAVGRVQLPRQGPTPGQPVRLAPRPPVLAGREALLTGLDALLSAGDGHSPRTVSLCGLGGAGKTSVAVEYAYRHLAEVGVAWQLAAEDATVLAAGFGELAAQLGVRGLADARDPVTSVHAVLARFPLPWLMLFDNAADLPSVAAFLPPAGPGRLLITSQNPNWPGQALDVPVLDREVAAGFLVSRTGDSDRMAARDLAGVLGGLPLALEQAAAYIQATGASLAWYLDVFRDRRADLLARGEPAGHPTHVVATLGLALSHLEADAPTAVALLRLLSCLAPEPVPLSLLFAYAQVAEELTPGVTDAFGALLGDQVAMGDAVAALRRYSLVTPAGDGLVSVHRLVQTITLGQLPTAQAREWEQAAAALVAAAVPADTELPTTWPVCAVLLPHARAVLDPTDDAMRRLTSYLGYSGSSTTAREMLQLIAYAHEADDANGPEHPTTLAVRCELARWTGHIADEAGARDQLAALLPICERVLGPEHPQTLSTRHELAYWTGEAGDRVRARRQLAALLPVRERVLGSEHPQTLSTCHLLARCTGAAGDRAGARRQLAALLPICERVLGSEHPQTLTARHELAYWTGVTGDKAGACDLFARLLSIRERVLGPEHPQTLATRHELAHWTGKAGDAVEARRQLAELLHIEERILGPEHPSTQITSKNLAHWAKQARRRREVK